MTFIQLPAVVIAFLVWFFSPPTSLADASQREALRRTLAGKSSRALTTADLPPGPAQTDTVPLTDPPATRATVEEPPDDPPAGAAAVAASARAAAAADETAKTESAKTDSGKADEQTWRTRMEEARGVLARDQMLAEAMQSRINSLVAEFVNRDDPAQRAKIQTDRQKALSELDRLQKQIVADEKAIAKIQDDARRQGVPPGWIR